MTFEEYEKAIPPNCQLRTYKEHIHYLGLCWGLTTSIKNATIRTAEGCGLCEFNNDEEIKQRELKRFNQSQVWGILNDE